MQPSHSPRVQRVAIVGRLEAVRDGLLERLNLRSLLVGIYRLALLALVVFLWRRALLSTWHFTIDDAGISYAYAKHIAEGRGPVAVVGGPWVEGYSNPLWVFLLVPFQWLGLELPEVAKWLGVLLLALAALLGGAALSRGHRQGFRWGALAALFAGALGCWVETAVWAVSGLENALFWALLAGLAYLEVREAENPDAKGWSGLLAFGACITRPEGALYILPWLALHGVQLPRASARRRSLRALALCLGPLALYHALHYLVFGHWLPNTFYAKSSRWTWDDGYDYLLQHVRESGLLYALPLIGLGLLRRSRLTLLLAWSCLAGVVFILYAGGDWMPHGRFVSFFAPAALGLAVAGLDSSSRALSALSRRRVPAELISLVLGAGLLWFWWQKQAPRLAQVERQGWCHFCERVRATKVVQRLTRQAQLPHATLVTQDFGGPAWLSDERLTPIDFLGLCDRNVALLRQDMRARHANLRTEFGFYQYLFHEQPTPPSWLSIPPNFWPFFATSAEYRVDYFRMNRRLLPQARGAYFGLHRGEFVDYFPPLSRLWFRPLSRQLMLVGSAELADFAAPPGAEAAATVAPGARVSVLVSVAALGHLSGDEQLQLSIEGAGGERVSSAPQALTRGFADVGHQLAPGEPLRVEFTLQLPASAASVYQVRLGVQSGGGEPDWSELEPLAAGAVLESEHRRLPRYPAALPPPLHSELRALRPAVTLGVERRRRFGPAARPDPALVERLVELGRAYERDGSSAEAYLADVWATQLDARAWERLSDRVFRLRQTSVDDGHTLELRLLQQYYASGDAGALAALIGFYLSRQQLEEASYFWRLRPGAEAPAQPWVGLQDALERLAALPGAAAASAAENAASEATLGLVARDPFGGAGDFETPELEGWKGNRAAFVAGLPSPDQGLPSLRGGHGRSVLSSKVPDEAARGALLSPPFVLRGRLLSLLIGGGSAKRRVGVELLIDDVPVQTASGIDSDFMFPVLWDISPHQGKTARLRVFDRGKNAHVLLDRVLLWD